MYITRERDFSHLSVIRKEKLAEKEVTKEDTILLNQVPARFSASMSLTLSDLMLSELYLKI